MSKYSRQICIFLLFLLGMSIEMNNFAARKLVTNETNMAEKLEVKELDQVVVRFSGDSGDGMQLAGNIFSTVSATVGNGISTFPDYPADIRAPQGSLTGVSGFQVHPEDTVPLCQTRGNDYHRYRFVRTEGSGEGSVQD